MRLKKVAVKGEKKRKFHLDTRSRPVGGSKNCPSDKQSSSSVNVSCHRHHHNYRFHHRLDRAAPLP
jgi:hypothetical protein